MFTGIVEGIGTITGIRPAGAGSRVSVSADFALDQTRIGESISVSGACLTAISVSKSRFDADVSAETLQKTTLGHAKVGRRVNLERALRLSDRLGGHLVTGHVDGVGTVAEKISDGHALRLTIRVTSDLLRYIVAKGSIAVDGVSLTVNGCLENSFDVSVIPHTAGVTTIGLKNAGDPVNVETDMIGKYVHRLISAPPASAGDNSGNTSKIDLNFLNKAGFY